MIFLLIPNSFLKRVIGLILRGNRRSIPKTDCKESLRVKTTLIKLEQFIFNRFNQDSISKEINKSWLQGCVDVFFNRDVSIEKKLPLSLVGYVEHYISKASMIKNAKGTFGLSKSRIDDFKILKKFLIEFQGKRTIMIEDVNIVFSNNFLNWMVEIKKYASGYAGRMLSVIKTTCNDAKLNGLKVDLQLAKVSGYKTKNEFIIVLTKEEIEKIKNVNLDILSLENARKWLLIGCYTGQRGGDLLNLTLDNINIREGLEIIELRQQKTNKQVAIPLLEETKEIISEGFPHKISQQKLNLYIKEVCRIAGIDTVTEGLLFNKVSKRKEYGKYEKWRLVSSHICRRSFCTNNFGVLPNYLIMSVTGHSSEKTFLGYIGKASYDYAKEFKDVHDKIKRTP